jgi:replicative DNA helicase
MSVGFGRGLSAPRMSLGEVEDLVVHIARNPSVFAEARRFIQPEHFNNSLELEFKVFVRILFELAPKYPESIPPYLAVYHAAGKWAAQGMRDEDKPRLLARPEDVEPGEQVGIIYHAYNVVPENLISARFGLDLLRAFLLERSAFDEARALVELGRGGAPQDFRVRLAAIQQRTEIIHSIGAEPARTLGEEWAEHTRRLEAHRGRRLIGLETGIEPLDERTLGIRGLCVLGAMPNVGKSALAVQLGVGVCRHYSDNDAVVVFVSLDMDRFEVYRRIHCHLSRIDWQTLMRGSPELRDRHEGQYFNQGHLQSLEIADHLVEEQIGRRLWVYDREALGPDVSSARLIALLNDAKARAGATRALLVVDYLQLLDIPNEVADRGELEVDKRRVRTVQEVVEATRTPANPYGDVVLAISETRKPGSSKEGWGEQLADLMGSARLAYAADAVLLYRRMDQDDVRRFYRIEGEGARDQAQRRLEDLDGDGVSPVVLTLAKARDGMTRGELAMEFEFRRSTFRVIERPNALRECRRG